MAAHPSARVAISSDFLDAFSELPRSQHGKVRRFIEQFKSNPTGPGINYEKIQGAADDKLRSVRIDQAYRGIVLKPEEGNVYMLLWVAHHDDAYRWARNRRYGIHPETGAIQVIPADEAAERAETELEDSKSEDDAEGLYSEFRDRELVRLGVPNALMPLVRSVQHEEDLDGLEEYLPQEAFEALFLLAAGGTLQEVDREMAALRRERREREVDTSDYAAALENPDTMRRFHVVEDELELVEILEAPLEKWRVFLHPSQRHLVEMEANGPVRVLGGAGTGKTVVAMHRAKLLADRLLEKGSEERVLFTTFTVNLAADIEESLAKICSPEALERIEVVNLDRWVNNFLRGQGYDFSIDYGRRTEVLWEKAMHQAPSEIDLPRSFYREEWEQIIQPYELTELQDYLRLPRIGRGTPLRRRQRKAVWPVFEEYQALLDENRLREADGAMRDARVLLDKKGSILPYRHIVVDEAQDWGRQAWLLLRAMVPEQPNDLFIVGDAHQRIYRTPVVMSHCGIDIVGRGRRLRINYRTTEENRRWAVSLLEGVEYDDLDGGVDDQSGYRSLLRGVDPEVHAFDSFSEEVEFLAQFLAGLTDGELKRVCLVARRNRDVDRYAGALHSRGITTYPIRRTKPEDREAPGVRLATLHRVKGLEFDRVIVAGADDGTIPLDKALNQASDKAERESVETRERSLLYVAVTRARKEVHVTCHGTPSRFL